MTPRWFTLRESEREDLVLEERKVLDKEREVKRSEQRVALLLILISVHVNKGGQPTFLSGGLVGLRGYQNSPTKTPSLVIPMVGKDLLDK